MSMQNRQSLQDFKNRLAKQTRNLRGKAEFAVGIAARCMHLGRKRCIRIGFPCKIPYIILAVHIKKCYNDMRVNLCFGGKLRFGV